MLAVSFIGLVNQVIGIMIAGILMILVGEIVIKKTHIISMTSEQINKMIATAIKVLAICIMLFICVNVGYVVIKSYGSSLTISTCDDANPPIKCLWR